LRDAACRMRQEFARQLPYRRGGRRRRAPRRQRRPRARAPQGGTRRAGPDAGVAAARRRLEAALEAAWRRARGAAAATAAVALARREAELAQRERAVEEGATCALCMDAPRALAFNCGHQARPRGPPAIQHRVGSACSACMRGHVRADAAEPPGAQLPRPAGHVQQAPMAACGGSCVLRAQPPGGVCTGHAQIAALHPRSLTRLAARGRPARRAARLCSSARSAAPRSAPASRSSPSPARRAALV